MLEREVFDKLILYKIFKIYKNTVALYHSSVYNKYTATIWQQKISEPE